MNWEPMAKHKHRDSVKPAEEKPEVQEASESVTADEQVEEANEQSEEPNELAEADEPSKTVVADDVGHKHERSHYVGGDHFYSEIARLVSTLFVGVLALMTFMLTVGVQRPKGLFAPALYAAIIFLPLNLLAFVFGQLFADMAKQAKFGSEKKLTVARKRLRVMRFMQMLLFILAVLSAAFLAYAASQFFFNIPANPMGGGAPTQ
jgi:hypothetical protein